MFKKDLSFGLYIPTYGGWFGDIEEDEKNPKYDYLKKIAKKAEELEFDCLWIPDHLLNPIKEEDDPAVESWTLATALAEATEQIKISQTALCEAFRPPAVLAKKAATLNQISNDRFLLSLGAGWYKREYESYGLEYHEHDQRIKKTKEAIQIIKKLWNKNGVNYNGKFYSIDKGILEPKPDRNPEIWYAGESDPSRELATEEAQGWLMHPHNIERIESNVKDMNNRAKEDMKYGVPFFTLIRETDEEARSDLKELVSDKGLFERTLETGLIGSPETVKSKLDRVSDLGIDHVLLKFSPTFEEMKYFDLI